MGVSCEDYNQCQLTQPDVTAHTVRCNIFPSCRHTHKHTRPHAPFLNLSQSHTHTFSISLSLSHTHRWMLGTITASDQAHRQQDCDKEIATTPHVLSVYCSHHHKDGRTYVCLQYVTANATLRVHACVCACMCGCIPCLAFYLGIASEQFTACHSLSRTGTKSERWRRMRWKKGKERPSSGRRKQDYQQLGREEGQ